jgi:long-chain acyl-CoA synthetase
MERIQDALLHGATAFGARDALIVDGKATSYEDLLRGVAAVAQYVAGAGTNAGDRVAFESKSKLAFIQTFYGIVSAGGVAVPIADGAAAQSVAEIVSRTRPRLVLSDRELACDAPVAAIADVLASPPDLDAAVEAVDGSQVGDASPALIMFTSGTTASKKGVVLSHGNLCQAVRNINAAMGVDNSIREYVAIPLHHSFGLGRLRCVLAAGGTLAMNNGPFSPLALAQSMRQFDLNALSGVPAVFGTLIDVFSRILEDCGPRIKVVEIGSAEMPRAHKERLLQLLPNASVFMHYGLTEASRSAFIEFRSDWPHIDTVGRAAPNVSITIRDEQGRLLPAGESGEIVVGGRHVFQGYLDNPELQDARLRAGGFFTGDFGCLDADGFLTLIGRKDDMINYGGVKLSPLEIERHLALALKDCDFAIVGVNDPKGLAGEVPVLAWTRPSPSRSCALDNAAIATLAGALLDKNCVPRQVIEVSRIPRTANGKIRRAELRELLIEELAAK